jgi:hypothetical protein
MPTLTIPAVGVSHEAPDERALPPAAKRYLAAFDDLLRAWARDADVAYKQADARMGLALGDMGISRRPPEDRHVCLDCFTRISLRSHRCQSCENRRPVHHP